MAIGKRNKPKQKSLWVAASELLPRSGHPFYTRLNRLLDEDGFDAWLEQECAPCFSTRGRPSIPPGVYFRMLFVGYLEGFQSERSIAWHCADRMSLRQFLGYELNERTPDHSSLTIWRQRLPLELYRRVFRRILGLVHRHKLIEAYAAGVDSTTIETNASLRRLVRKDSGESYREYVKGLMREAGGDPTDAAAVARFDKKRKGKTLSNRDWQSETDPDTRIARMKDGTTHLAYKPEHAVDLDTGAMLGVSVHLADQGDTAGISETLDTVTDNLASLGDEHPELLCLVTDKGYHQAELIKEINHKHGITTYIPERESKQRRRWHGDVRGLENVTKRYLIHATAYNLGLVMRAIFGRGTPKGMADALGRPFVKFFALLTAYFGLIMPENHPRAIDSIFQPNIRCSRLQGLTGLQGRAACSTGWYSYCMQKAWG